MKNTFGNNLSVTISGESHGASVTAVLDGIPAGTNIDLDYIKSRLALRRPSGNISTKRQETDEFSITSGVFQQKATGTPICIVIPNCDTKSNDYGKLQYVFRPGHADFSANEKYHGFQDYRGGGHFSGRITVGLVAAGAICLSLLKSKGILIGTHIYSCGGIYDRIFENYFEDILKVSEMSFPVLDECQAEKMKLAIENAASDKDSIGGILETVIIGLPSGIGEPWFDSFESIMSHILFSIPAIKGIEFGSGFGFAGMKGSTANDPLAFKDGKIITLTNNNGGINGGITNGMPVVYRCAVKPTPSIAREQDSVSTATLKNEKITVQGRHDPCIVHRAAAVVNACSAIAVTDMLLSKYGNDLMGL